MVAKADGVKSVTIFVENNLIFFRFEEYVRALQALINAHVERKVTSIYAMMKVRKLLGRGHLINKSDYFEKISKLTQEVQRHTAFVESMDMELQTMPGQVEEASLLRDELSKANLDEGGLTAVNKVVLARGTEISKINATTGSLVGFCTMPSRPKGT